MLVTGPGSFLDIMINPCARAVKYIEQWGKLMGRENSHIERASAETHRLFSAAPVAIKEKTSSSEFASFPEYDDGNRNLARIFRT